MNARRFSAMRIHRHSDGLREMAPARRHDKLIADLSAERAMLRETQMMGTRPTPTNQTRLFGHETDVLLSRKGGRDGPAGSCRCRRQC